MKITFSRKGFDSSDGGVPSPIFEDGRLLSLPIPYRRDKLVFEDLKFDEIDVGTLVEDLTRRRSSRVRRKQRCHLDPDLRKKALLRREIDWRPAFGQLDQAQAHLVNEGVDKGDLFLFFGWFRGVHVDVEKRHFSFTGRPWGEHVIFGWLQVGEIYGPFPSGVWVPKWVRSHPHASYREPQNRIYVARDRLHLDGMRETLPGGGVFRKYHEDLRLTAPDQPRRSHWRLPGWMYPFRKKGTKPLSFHRNKKWNLLGEWLFLDTVGRGQEFVLNCDNYPKEKMNQWLRRIFHHAR